MKIKFQPNALFGVWASIALYFVWFWFACLRMAEHQTERKIGIGKFRATRERSHNIAYAPYITSYIIQVESQGDHRKNNRDLFSFHGTSNISLHRQIQHPSTSEIFSSFFFARFSWFMSMKNFRFLFVRFFSHFKASSLLRKRLSMGEVKTHPLKREKFQLRTCNSLIHCSSTKIR